ncbi:MAG TPA: pyridoxal 5'-phosphate synthase glutaminase subunit PdxT [Deltaproteobacteria bacterium]|nr:pyridoxal 5'-phosphate synthase glutaminase subunit PdxT [Deltaproteobacteria bacterium]HQI80438.1 pyridoxal 5'-phosphate synthase glutaminase subunit PdxT [Deltaproteobacteria bacterium]
MVGILALQGDVAEHAACMSRLGGAVREVRTPRDCDGIDGLILPGGESTAMRRLIASAGLREPVRGLLAQGMPVWGTCAGVVLLAEDGVWPCPGLKVERNAYGPQPFSSVVRAETGLHEVETELVFIRAPRILEAPAGARVLCRAGGDITALRWEAVLLTTFHPELVEQSPFPGHFLDMVRSRAGIRSSSCRGPSAACRPGS